VVCEKISDTFTPDCRTWDETIKVEGATITIKGLTLNNEDKKIRLAVEKAVFNS
jgi:hypothetical protein